MAMIKNNNYKKSKVNNCNSVRINESGNKYFFISKIEIIWNSGRPIGYSFGEGRSIFNKEIFKHAFRDKLCNCCNSKKLSNEFYWKVKGFEGPFVCIWGTRQPKCIRCEQNSKKAQYKKRMKKSLRINNVISGFKIREFVVEGEGVYQELDKLLLDFSLEVINGAVK